MPRFPFPLNKGDKLRAFHILKMLNQIYETNLIVLTDEKIKQDSIIPIKEITETLNIFYLKKIRFLKIIPKWVFTKKPLQCLYYENDNVLEAIQNKIDEVNPEFVFFQLARLESYIRKIKFQNKIVDLMDCFSFHYWMRAQDSKWPLNYFWLSEAKSMRNVETSVINLSSKLFIISQRDKQLLPFNSEKISILMNGVEFYKIEKQEPIYDLVFFGNLQYQPNIQAIRFIVDKILPILKQNHPNISLLIAGANPAQKLVNYLKKNNINLEANPIDRNTTLQKAKIFVGPLFWNTGIQNKILEAISVGLPTVISNNAAEALNLINNYTTLTALSEQNFAENIDLLLNDSQKYNRISNAAIDFISQNYDWEQINKYFKNIIKNN